MIRLGVAVKIMGRPGLRVGGGRAAVRQHLSVRLLGLRAALLYLAEQQIGCYRLAGDMVALPEGPRDMSWARELESCADLAGEVGRLARERGIRLTLHLPLHAALGSPDPAVAERAALVVAAAAGLLEALGCGREGVLVLHAGGVFGDRAAALHRFAAGYERLPAAARERLALEPDEDCFGLADLLRLHQQLGVPLVFDALHHQINNPLELPLAEALGLALSTWPRGVRPKAHFSTQRTEAHVLPARRGAEARVLAPQLGQHADFVNPFEFAALLRAARGLPGFDLMLEAKAADLALLRLREDLRRVAPELAAGVH